MDLKWICIIIFVFVYVFVYMFKDNNFCMSVLNFCTKSQSYNKLHDDEVDMDDDLSDIIWWTKPMLKSVVEKPLPTLPDEVIFEILVRLPVRSLLQFRSVCKSWKHLISIPQFAKDHLQCSLADETLSHQRLVTSKIHDSFHWEFISLPMQSLLEHTCAPTKAVYLKMLSRFKILGTIDGLVCLCDINHDFVRLWNPSTRLRSKKSPIMNSDPRHNIRLYGFGYDYVHDKYKAYVGVGYNYEHVTKVYTFGSNSWTTIQGPHRHWHEIVAEGGQFVCGTLNWMGMENVIISFDLGKETHDELSLPDVDYDIWNSFPQLGVIRNYLCVGFEETNLSHLDVWLMKEYGVQHSWTRLVVIPHRELQLPIMNLFTPLWIWGKGCVLGIINKDFRRLLLDDFYNQLKFLFITRERDLPHSPLHIYYESLVSP